MVYIYMVTICNITPGREEAAARESTAATAGMDIYIYICGIYYMVLYIWYVYIW